MTTTMTPPPAVNHSLSVEQVKQFHRDGFLAPLVACSPQTMTGYYPHIDKVIMTDVLGCKNSSKGERGHNRHLDDLTVFRICTLPAILGAMRSVMGNDLILWRTNFFDKPPGAKEIPWHQDRNYWPLEPEIVISAWIAVDPSTVENACLQVIPGSHRKIYNHIDATPDMEFKQMADGVDLSKKVDVELLPGEFMLFNERTLHHSEVNRSQKRRLGLAVRAILPQVRVLSADSPLHKMMVISGRDTMGFNELVEPPKTDRV